MKQYEVYKDSGIQWLGEIPSHWVPSKLKHHCRIVLGKMLMSNPPKGQENQYTLEKYLKSRNIGWMDLLLNDDVEEMWFNETEKALYELKPNDIVMNEGGDIGKAALWKEQSFKCYIQNSVNKLTVDSSLSALYLQYLLFAIAQTNYFWSVVNPVSIAHLTKEKLSETPIILPPLAEQEVIAAYLDQKVGKIDAILSEKEAMVKQLQQYRKSLISETVTRGLDPNVPMKDSGVDWIGQIPQHWSMVRLKYVSSLQSGSNLTSEQIEGTGEYPVFGGNGLRGYYHEYNTEGDRVLIGRQGALCGNINFASGKFWATEHAVVCHPIKQYNVIWLGSLLEIMNLNQYSIASAQPGLSVDRIKQLEIPLPPFEEQEKIGSLIEKKDSELKQTISELQSQIEDLKAYKSSIITEAVTGKVDLRDWKPSEVTA